MIILPDNSRTDGVAHRMLQMINSNLPILLLSRVEEINFNEEILSLANNEYVIIDFIEEGWDAEYNDTLIVGKNTKNFPFLKGDGWDRLHNFVHDNPPKLYFKRELKLKDKTDTILPIEYPNWQSDYILDTKEEFDNRPVSALNYWGRSHEARLILHGEIWKSAPKIGYSICDNIFTFNSFMQDESNPFKIATFNIPHYSRIDISEIMKINALSKLSISLWGCGKKCFRSTGESIVNSVVVLPEDDLAYSYPFINGDNCIMFSTKGDVTGLKKEWDILGAMQNALANDNLYDIYLEGKKVADFYRIDNYIPYLQNIINNA